MENIAKKLKELRESRNLTLVEAAKLAGFKNFQTLGKIEQGTRDIKTDDLIALAKAYSFDLNFFLLGEPQVQNPRLFWRSNPNPPKDKSAQHKLTMFFERYTNLTKLLNFSGAKLDLPHIDLHGITIHNAGQYGEIYSEKLGLGSRPALLLTSILEKECGLPIFYLELPNGASAISLVSDGCAAICINLRDAPWRQRFDIAHELFHIIHQSANTTACGTSDDQHIERLANAFAAGLLLPQRMIENEIDILRKAGNTNIVALVAMACNMGVSLPALIWRLVNIRRMKSTMAENILRSDAVKEHDQVTRRKEYTNSPHISQRYVSMVFEAMGRGVMSRMRAAEYLDVPYIKLDDVLHSEGLTYNEKHTVKVAIM